MNDRKSATKAPLILAVSLALLAPLPALAQPPGSNQAAASASKAPIPAALQQNSVDERALNLFSEVFERVSPPSWTARR
jgi:hypothetical protein